MKTIAALVLTAATLAVGCFLLGYGYSEYWEQKPAVLIEGFVWLYTDSALNTTQDVYYGRVPWRTVEVAVMPHGGDFDDWAHVGTIQLSHYRKRLPARSRGIALETVVDVPPPFTSLRLRVEPGAAARCDKHGRVNVPARYAIAWGSDAYVFSAVNGYEAEEMAKAVVWRIFEERFGGDVDRFVGRMPE